MSADAPAHRRVARAGITVLMDMSCAAHPAPILHPEHAFECRRFETGDQDTRNGDLDVGPLSHPRLAEGIHR